jgi:hypothetical protein
MMVLSEEKVRRNDPIELFELEGQTLTVRCLPAKEAERWAQDALEVVFLKMRVTFLVQRMNATMPVEKDGAYEAYCELADTIRKLQVERWEALKARLVEYDSTVFTPEVMEKASAAQLESAFNTLRNYNDPFLVSDGLALSEVINLRLASVGTKG